MRPPLTNRSSQTDSEAAKLLRMQSDPEVLDACLAGQDEAWDELLDRYARLVYSIPRHYGLPAETCEDVLQEVFCILVRQLPRQRNLMAIRSWLMTTTHRISRQFAEKARHRGEPLPEQLESDSPPGEDVLRWERQHLVHHALSRLGGRCRELLTALFLRPGEPSYEAIARELDMPIGSIGPNRARCLMRLMRLMEDDAETKDTV